MPRTCSEPPSVLLRTLTAEMQAVLGSSKLQQLIYPLCSELGVLCGGPSWGAEGEHLVDLPTLCQPKKYTRTVRCTHACRNRLADLIMILLALSQACTAFHGSTEPERPAQLGSSYVRIAHSTGSAVVVRACTVPHLLSGLTLVYESLRWSEALLSSRGPSRPWRQKGSAAAAQLSILVCLHGTQADLRPAQPRNKCQIRTGANQERRGSVNCSRHGNSPDDRAKDSSWHVQNLSMSHESQSMRRPQTSFEAAS